MTELTFHVVESVRWDDTHWQAHIVDHDDERIWSTASFYATAYQAIDVARDLGPDLPIDVQHLDLAASGRGQVKQYRTEHLPASPNQEPTT